MSTTTIHQQESAAFLRRIQNDNLSTREILLAAPTKFLNLSIEEVELPKRFLNKIEKVSTIGDLLKLKLDELAGRNLGARTIAATNQGLIEFFKKKIEGKDYSTAPLREQMEDYAKDMLAREARIWEMRMGLRKERYTLEATGEKFGLTRERVRQIEAVLFSTFSKRFPAVKSIQSVVKDGMKLADLIKATDGLIDEADTLPLVGILENLTPKLYLIEEFGVSIVSTTPRTSFETSVRQALNACEETFRNSEVLITDKELLTCLKKHGLDDTALQLAMTKVSKEGHWIDSKLLSPNSDKTNIAVGVLQASERPMHLEELTKEIFLITHEQTTPETLRSCLSLVPSVHSFGYGTVGFKRHTFLNPIQIKNVISTVENVIDKGPDGYQWSAKDLINPVREKFPAIDLNYHQLNVILHESTKLQYLGRLTWSDKKVEERTFYKEIFRDILKKAGKPLPEKELIDEARKVRGLHLNSHLAHDVELLEVKPNVWGLTRRDHPFSKKEIAAMLKVFDKSFGEDFNISMLHAQHIDTKGIRDNEILKVLEVHS